jgi:hypothetical protein
MRGAGSACAAGGGLVAAHRRALLGLLVVGVADIVRPCVHVGDVAAAVLFLAVIACLADFLATQLAAKAIADPCSLCAGALTRSSAVRWDAHVAGRWPQTPR